jgi:hypothetical protein
MKMKMKFNSAAMKGFFINHGEKIGFSLAVIAMLYLTYSAFTVGRYDKTPEKMANDARITLDNINDPSNAFSPREHNIIMPEPEYAVQVEGAMTAVDATQFAMATPWNTPIRDTRVRRDEPQYFPPRELRLAYGFGAVGAKGEKAKYIGRQWVVVTAAVPFGEQLAEYRRLFDNSLFPDPTLDMPHYATFAVERAEVKPEAPDAPPDWKNVDVATIFEAADRDFAAERPDPVNKKYVDMAIADFCPPLVGKRLGEEVAHLPEVPLAISEPQTPGADANAQPAPVVAPGGAAPARRPRLGEPSREEPAPAAAAMPGAKEVVPLVSTKLFRFFDYTVEHNKTYRYRVKLALNNPNKGVVIRYLKKPDLANGETRETDWSDPSDTVTTPPDFYILASDAKVSASAAIEPLARLLIVRWVQGEGVEVPHEVLKDRGTLLDFPSVSASVPAPAGGQPHSATVDFITHSLLVDVMGGDQMIDPKGRRFRSPTETLVMGPDGQLVLHNSVLEGFKYDGNRGGGAAPKAAEPEPGAEPAGEAPAPAGGGLFDSILGPKK